MLATDSSQEHQREEATRLFALHQFHTLIYLKGPYGSGKTYLARHFVEQLAISARTNGQKILSVYASLEFDESDGCGARVKNANTSEVLDSLHMPEGWTAAPVSGLDERFPGVVDVGKLNQPGQWLELRSRLPDGWKMVIIIDDYDQWRRYMLNQHQIRDQDFVDVLSLWNSNVTFLLTGKTDIRSQATPRSIGVDEHRFLNHCEFVHTRLPSDETTEHMIEETLHLDLKNDYDLALGKRIGQYTGNYPLLISVLSNILSNQDKHQLGNSHNETRSSRNSAEQAERVIDQAMKKAQFQDAVKCLWDELGDTQKTVLQLIAMAQQLKSTLDIVYAKYNRRSEKGYMAKTLFYETLGNLREQQLLLNQNNEIASLAVLQYVLHNPDTQKLSKRLGIRLEGRNFFTFNGFLGFWLAGFFLYFVLLLIKVFVETQIDTEIPSGVLILAWFPAVIYGFILVRLRSGS